MSHVMAVVISAAESTVLGFTMLGRPSEELRVVISLGHSGKECTVVMAECVAQLAEALGSVGRGAEDTDPT